MSSEERVGVVIVGAGQAGLGAAHRLKEAGFETVILEKARIGETWRTQRWDSFTLNTPNWMNGLPGARYQGADRDGFMSHTELVESFETYAASFDLPIREGTEVTQVASHPAGGYQIEIDGDAPDLHADAVVVASGILQTPKIPPIAESLPPNTLQLHTGTYRSPAELPEGSVLVVGGGQSGAQIVEDLIGAGRTVYFSISKVARLPRRYRGRDFMDWWVDMGLWDIATDEVENPAILTMTNPLVSGVGPRGHSVSFQQLAARGVRMMGRLAKVDNAVVTTDDRGHEYLRYADEFSIEQRSRIDAYIAEHGVKAPAAENDPGDQPLMEGQKIEFTTHLNLEEANVTTVIWATGFTADFSWIKVPVLDEFGMPVHDRGLSSHEGIYFIGFPWLSKRKSSVIYGIDEDAQRIAAAITQQLA